MDNTTFPKREDVGDSSTAERTRGGPSFTPRVDIVESENELTLFADLPGVQPSDLDIRFEKGELVLHGKCNPRHREEDALACEYGVGDFYRTFSVSESIDSDRIAAELKHGVLTVHLPKSERIKPKRIAVANR